MALSVLVDELGVGEPRLRRPHEDELGYPHAGLDPEGSLAWLPHLEFCDAADPVWTNTMDLLHSAGYPLWRRGSVDGLVGRNGRNEAETRFSWNVVAEGTLELYESIH